MNELQKTLDQIAGVLTSGAKYKKRIADTLTEFAKISNDVAAENLGDTTNAIATSVGNIFTAAAELIG